MMISWYKKCPSCSKELSSLEYPDILKTFDYRKIFNCPKCNVKFTWSKSHTLAAKYGLIICAIAGLVFAVSAFNVFSNYDTNSSIENNPASLIFTVSFFITIIALVIALIGSIGKKLIIYESKT